MEHRRVVARLLDALIALVAVALVWNVLTSRNASPTLEYDAAFTSLLSVGQQFTLPGVSWNRPATNVVLFVSPACPACQESSSWYAELAKRADADPNVRLVALSQLQGEALDAWLAVNRIMTSETVQTSTPLDLGFFITPTVLTVNSDGLVTNVFHGRLSEADEAHFVGRLDPANSLSTLDNSYSKNEIHTGDLARFTGEAEPILLDVRNRDEFAVAHLAGSVNIPLAELSLRAPIELPTSHDVVVSCAPGAIALSQCRLAAYTLREMGFQSVFVLT